MIAIHKKKYVETAKNLNSTNMVDQALDSILFRSFSSAIMNSTAFETTADSLLNKNKVYQ